MTLSNPNRTIVPRGRIWKKNRAFVLERDGRKCYRCGKENLYGHDAHVDHIKPVSIGGEDELWNYAACCALCNKTKSDKFEAVDEALYLRRKAEAASGVGPIGRLPSLKAENRHGNFTPVSLTDVEKMFAAYQVQNSATYIVRQCGVGKPTAKRYIENGDPSRGVEPFRERLTRIQAERAARVDERTIEAGADIAARVRQLFEAAFRKIAQVDAEGNILQLNVMPDFRDLVELGRFYQVLTGGADHRTDHQHKFSTMTEAELRRIVAEGRRAVASIDGTVIDVLPEPKAIAAASEDEF